MCLWPGWCLPEWNFIWRVGGIRQRDTIVVSIHPWKMLHTGSLRVSLLFPLSILVAAKFLPKFIYVSLSLSLLLWCALDFPLVSPADIALPNFWKGRDGSYYRVDFRGIKGEAAIYRTRVIYPMHFFTPPRLSFPWNSIRLVKTLQLRPLKLFNLVSRIFIPWILLKRISLWKIIVV